MGKSWQGDRGAIKRMKWLIKIYNRITKHIEREEAKNEKRAKAYQQLMLKVMNADKMKIENGNRFL